MGQGRQRQMSSLGASGICDRGGASSVGPGCSGDASSCGSHSACDSGRRSPLWPRTSGPGGRGNRDGSASCHRDQALIKRGPTPSPYTAARLRRLSETTRSRSDRRSPFRTDEGIAGRPTLEFAPLISPTSCSRCSRSRRYWGSSSRLATPIWTTTDRDPTREPSANNSPMAMNRRSMPLV